MLSDTMHSDTAVRRAQIALFGDRLTAPEPAAPEPDFAEPVAAESDSAEPAVPEPDVAEPDIAEPAVGESADAVSGAAELVVTVRIEADPGRSAELARQIAAALRSVLRPDQDVSLALRGGESSGPVGERAVLIHPPSRTVRWRGAELDLTRLEFDLLLYLAREPGRIFSRESLLADVWHAARHLRTHTRTLDVHIRRLRDKLGPTRLVINTVRGVGYGLARDADIAIAG